MYKLALQKLLEWRKSNAKVFLDYESGDDVWRMAGKVVGEDVW